MKRGCLLSLLMLFAFIGGAYWYFEPRFSSPGNWVAAIASGLFGVFAVGCFQNFLIHRANLKALRRSNGRMSPQDGKMLVAAGLIQPLRGESYNTPFTNKPAVICEYEAYRMIRHSSSKTGNSTHKKVTFGGLHMIPSSINTGIGEIKLLSFPTLIGFAPVEIENPADRQRAREFYDSTRFEKVQIKDVISRVKEILVDDDGSIHNDWKNEEGIPLDSLTLAETSVPSGSQVVAFGIYSAEKGGIISTLTRTDGTCKLYNGDAKSVAPKIRNSAIGNLFGCAFFIAIATVVVPFILQQWQASLNL